MCLWRRCIGRTVERDHVRSSMDFVSSHCEAGWITDEAVMIHRVAFNSAAQQKTLPYDAQE